MIRNLSGARLTVLAGALLWAIVGCGSSSGRSAGVSERQVYNQEGAYIAAALNAAGISTKPTYDTPDPTIEYCTDGVGAIDQGCVNMARSTTLRGLTTPQMIAMTAVVAAYWKHSGYGQLSSAPDGLATGAVPPGKIYELSASATGDGYQIPVTVASVTNTHTFPTTAP